MKKSVEIKGTKSVRPNGSYSYKYEGTVIALIKVGKSQIKCYFPKRLATTEEALKAQFGKLAEFVNENPCHVKNNKDPFFGVGHFPLNTVTEDDLLLALDKIGEKYVKSIAKAKSEGEKSKASSPKSPTKSKAKSEAKSPTKSMSPSEINAEMIQRQKSAVKSASKKREEKALSPVTA